MTQQEAASQTATMKKQLQELAAQCNQAFVAAGLQDSAHPQVRKALELCSSYLQCSQQGESFTSNFQSLEGRPTKSKPDHHGHETVGLGEDLVATLTEDKHQPPDVSLKQLLITAWANHGG